MSNSIIPFNFESHSVRVVIDENGEPWFSANEMCGVLGYGNPRQAIESHVDADDVQKLDVIDSMGRNQLANHINESGLYALIFGSTKESAKRFKRWVTHEVLPTIRKTGSYSVKASPSTSGLPEYRKARAIDMATKSADRIFALLPNLCQESRQTVLCGLLSRVAGYEVLPLPALEEHFMTAAEVGAHLGISANMVGRIANKHGLKTEEFGNVFLDKSPHSEKQVESFRYSRRGLDKIAEVLADTADTTEAH